MPSLPERFGDFLLVQRLGGGMAEVFLAVRLGDREGRSLVVKRPPLGERASGAASQAILREAEVLEEVSAPELVRLVDRGSLAGLPFVALEHHRGTALDRLVVRAPLPLAAAWTVALDVLRALAALHAAGWVHGDVASSNVLVDDAGEARLCDLGIAEREGAARSAIMGKPGYVAPELVSMRAAAQAEDIYAWAVIVAESLRGERLFPERDIAEAAARADVRGAIAAVDVEGVLAACLSRDPAARPRAKSILETISRAIPDAGASVARAVLAEEVARATDESARRSLDETSPRSPPSLSPAKELGPATVSPTVVDVATARVAPEPALERSAAPRSSRALWIAVPIAAALALAIGIVGGRTLEKRAIKPRGATLTLPALPARTEYHLDGRTLIVTEVGRPMPIAAGSHTISLAGPKRESKEYEFVVEPGDNVVIVAVPVARVDETKEKPSANPKR